MSLLDIGSGAKENCSKVTAPRSASEPGSPKIAVVVSRLPSIYTTTSQPSRSMSFPSASLRRRLKLGLYPNSSRVGRGTLV